MTSLIFIHLGLLGEKAKKVLAFCSFSDFPKGVPNLLTLLRVFAVPPSGGWDD